MLRDLHTVQVDCHDKAPRNLGAEPGGVPAWSGSEYDSESCLSWLDFVLTRVMTRARIESVVHRRFFSGMKGL